MNNLNDIEEDSFQQQNESSTVPQLTLSNRMQANDKTIPKKNRKEYLKKQNATLMMNKSFSNQNAKELSNDWQTSSQRDCQHQQIQQMNFNGLNDDYLCEQNTQNLLNAEIGKYIADPKKLELEDLFNQSMKNEPIKQYQYQSYHEKIYNALKQKKYSIKSYLCSGGEGDVFLGYLHQNDESEIEEYAFKMQFKSAEELKQEVEIMKSFEKNINIIKLKDEIKVDENLYILILEKCQCSLKDEINKFIIENKKISTEQLIQIIFDLLDGLIQLRIYETLHLDIKPTNILKNLEGNYVYTDFGISSKFKEGKKIELKGETGLYASQEQLKKQIDKINYKSDVYSLGVTLKLIVEKLESRCDNSFSKLILELIEQNMKQQNNEDRQDVKEIHKIFFQQLKSHQFQSNSFLLSYNQKIMKIKDLFVYDIQKDVKYFKEILLYYSNLHVNVLQGLRSLFYPIESQSISNEIQQSFRREKQIIALSCQDEQDKNIGSINFFKDKHYYNQFVGESLRFLGLCYYDWGDSQSALNYVNQSLKQFEQYFDKIHPSIASCKYLLGSCNFKLGDSKKAQQYLKEYVAICKQLYKGNNLSQSYCLMINAKCYRDSKNYFKMYNRIV